MVLLTESSNVHQETLPPFRQGRVYMKTYEEIVNTTPANVLETPKQKISRLLRAVTVTKPLPPMRVKLGTVDDQEQGTTA